MTRADRGSWMEGLAAGGPESIRAFVARQGADELRLIEHHWPFWCRPAQAAPPGDWRVWLVMAGRGYGKTRMGAEWVRAAAEASGRARIALVGASAGEVRRVMVEGESGILALGDPERRPVFEPSVGRLRCAPRWTARSAARRRPGGRCCWTGGCGGSRWE